MFAALTLAIGEADGIHRELRRRRPRDAARPSRPPTLGQPAVLQAVVLTGAYLAPTALIGLGLGTIVRHSAAAIGTLFGGVYVVALFIAGISPALMAYVPISILLTRWR